MRVITSEEYENLFDLDKVCARCGSTFGDHCGRSCPDGQGLFSVETRRPLKAADRARQGSKEAEQRGDVGEVAGTHNSAIMQLLCELVTIDDKWTELLDPIRSIRLLAAKARGLGATAL